MRKTILAGLFLVACNSVYADVGRSGNIISYDVGGGASNSQYTWAALGILVVGLVIYFLHSENKNQGNRATYEYQINSLREQLSHQEKQITDLNALKEYSDQLHELVDMYLRGMLTEEEFFNLADKQAEKRPKFISNPKSDPFIADLENIILTSKNFMK